MKIFAERRQTLNIHLPAADLPALADEVAEPPRGSAWYDSSLDLARGLEVTQHQDDEPCPDWLPQAAWLQWQARLPAGGAARA